LSCQNQPENEVKRNEALKKIKLKNPKAFNKKGGKIDHSHNFSDKELRRIVIEINKNHMEM
jgi:hypothetical protein